MIRITQLSLNGVHKQEERCSMNIQFSPPDITDLEIEEVASAMRSGWITTGPKTKLFEKKIAEYCGVSHGKAVCLNSATACLEMILRKLGIGPGDEVITSAYTYTASASVVCHVGAKLVLVDVARDSYKMDLAALENAITDKTKAIIPVDIGGVMENYDEIFEIVERKKNLFTPSENEIQKALGRVAVVADAAHSFGATYHGRRSGTVADFTSFSFHAVKNLTTAEGGALTWREITGIDNDELYRWFMLYTLHGQSKDALSKMKLGAWEYDVVYPAYKFNMTDITAAIGLVQLQRFDGLSARRKHIIKEYDKLLLPLGVDRVEHFGSDFEGNGHLYLMRIPGITETKRNEIVAKMADAGVACNVHFKPLPMHTAYKNLGFDVKDYPNAYRQYANEITLPLHTLLTDEEVEYIAGTMQEILEGEQIEKTVDLDNLSFERVFDADNDKIRMVQEIIKDCGERMFLDDGLLHWADPLPASFVKNESLDKALYLIKDKTSNEFIATYSITEKPGIYFDMEKKAMYFQWLAVSPEFWRHGVGRMIMQKICEIAQSKRCECVRCTVYEQSPRAVSFLTSQGFETIYKRPTKNFIVLCMERRIFTDS